MWNAIKRTWRKIVYPKFPRERMFKVEGFTLILIDRDKLQDRITGPYKNVNGMCYKKKREIYVSYRVKKDKNGSTMPMLETLGHEPWHLPELGGSWHD